MTQITNMTKRPRGRPRKNPVVGDGLPPKLVHNKGDGFRDNIRQDRLSPIADPESVQERLSVVVTPGMGAQAAKLLEPIAKRKTNMACLGIPSYILNEGDQEYAKCIRGANLWKKQRIREYFIAHGHVSTGVHSLLASAALAMAASRFIYAMAARGEVDPHRMKLASSLSDSSRQNELSAWELCQREAVVAKRNENGKISMPWVVATETGIVKKNVGRPRKQLMASEVTLQELKDGGFSVGQAGSGSKESDSEGRTDSVSGSTEAGDAGSGAGSPVRPEPDMARPGHAASGGGVSEQPWTVTDSSDGIDETGGVSAAEESPGAGSDGEGHRS